MSRIPFEIYQPAIGEEANVTTSDWPLEVSAIPTSLKSITIAKQWIEGCLNSHPKCARSINALLPTRVIDVAPANDLTDPKLCVTHSEKGRYATLSHCWGTSYRVTLTKNNLPKFEQSIQTNKLPKTFQDAIHITRLLGVRYLWIDALCIVQDDQNDWKRESASMYSVFENAVFSVSAVAASDSHSGMLHERNPRSVQVDINGISVGVRQKLDSLAEAMAKSRLETRAWCYQERLLPKGILHIAPSQMYWECGTSIASEAAPAGQRPGQPNISNDNVTRQASCSNKNSPIDFCREWLHLVSVYSARQVTRPTDRLPAIAGLADKAKKENELYGSARLIPHGKIIPSRDKYFARSATSSSKRPRRPIASIWSWASTNDAVEFLTVQTYSERSPSQLDAKFLLPESDDDEEIEMSSAILPLEAPIKCGTCRFGPEGSRDPDEASFKPSGSLLVDDGLRCFVDYLDDPVAKNCYGVRISNWQQPGINSNKKRKGDEDSDRAFYLLLERVQHISSDKVAHEDLFGTFRRIGMGYDMVRKVDKIFANAERRVLHLV